MDTLLLSVIICTYNRAALLANCLESIFKQQAPLEAYEVRVVDNSSTDNTREAVSLYNGKIRHLKYVFEEKQGLSHARNRGCDEAAATYLCYLDDDAIAPPEYISGIIQIIKEYSPDILGGPVYPFYITKKPRWFKDEYEIRKYADKSGFSPTTAVSGGNFIIRKDLLEKLGRFDVNLGMKGRKIGMGEERKIIEQYRAVTPAARQKIYYALECYINHLVPPEKMRIGYLLKRNYRTGRDSIMVKNRGAEFAFSAVITGINEVFGELKHGFRADPVKIMNTMALRTACVQEVFKRYGFRAVILSLFRALKRRLLLLSSPSGGQIKVSKEQRARLKKIDVLWLIEHVAREMDVACAVKYLAQARYGLDIEIKHVYQSTLENMELYRPKVIVMHAFYNAHDLAVKDYVERWPAAHFFNLAWEEIFYKGHLKLKAPADSFTRQKVIHHAWGNFFKQYLMENGVTESNIFLNGNPAYELYLPPYNKYYPGKKWLAAKYNLDAGKRWVIVPENYRWAFIKDSTIDWRVREGADRAELTGMRDFARDSLIHLLKWCNSAAGDKGLEVIFRPKPVTMMQEMEDFFREYIKETPSANLRFIKGESVREWILASDVVISSFSTTLIEAAIAGKPAYMVEPLPLTESFEADWYEYVPRIHNATEFQAACQEKSFPMPNRLKNWAQGEMLSRGDPISNLADFIYTLVQRRPAPASLKTRLLYLYRRLRNPYRKDYFNPRTHENDTFDDTYVNQKVEEWGEILRNYKPVASAKGT